MPAPITAVLHVPQGRLEVICGCMFAGKTTELIRRLTQAGPGRAVCLRPLTDTRSSAAATTTHDGASFAAVAVAGAAGIVEAAGDAEVVGIDEAHFFGRELVGPVLALVRAGRRVIVAGVERDHRGGPFEPFPGLLIEADEVVKLTACCALCGGPAVHSQRMGHSDARIVVGGADAYQPRCRRCFTGGDALRL